VCTNRPVRQDGLDQFVWDEMIRLLEDPALVQGEIDRRREAARQTNPLQKREEELRLEQSRLEKSIERLINAYQEGLVTLPQLRQRMPELRRQMQAVESELHSLEMAAVDEARYLQLAETLATFRGKLRVRAETLDVRERQQIFRLLVKEILVGSDTITIRHSIPVPPSGSGPAGTAPSSSGMIEPESQTGYLLRSGSHHSALGSTLARSIPSLRLALLTRFYDWGLQPHPDQFEHTPVHHSHAHASQKLVVRNRIEVAF
jgi:site-specific DNA recombinase